ncbi:ABC transporter substrate-binding protein [Mariniplasma anaerobium]|uniref:DUF5011 domain-containing protein n=1 Tax=Mariniplasma anaerobium TaxID=2735436 RepID=A0A7U9TI34_9MOLU|nr:ABC transporter substrate-binding protein [Mariniplasma anaerobium]BCR36690.1 hypothetical protein MPAN_015830 [Mariniplasma anaerobium]
MNSGVKKIKLHKKILIIFIVLFTSLTVVACKNDPLIFDQVPSIMGADDLTILVFDAFDPLHGVTAIDEEDGDLTSSIIIKTNDVNNEEVGNYTVVYEVKDSVGNTTSVTRYIIVSYEIIEDYPLAQYQNGVDLSNLDGVNKDILFAAAERYLLDNVYGGVPLYTYSHMMMYSERVQLFSDEYNGVLGYGDEFSQLNLDDSNVLMDGSTYGNTSEYTWRSAYSFDPVTLNPWESDDSDTSEFNDLFNGALYNFFFDSSKKGYEILPELAQSLPQPISGSVIDGTTYAKQWAIVLRDDLEWKFNPNTDTSNLGSDYEKLDANDYMWTFKYALDHEWFRAISGGSDFISSGIKNIEAYLDGLVPWEFVGIKLIDDYTIELEYEQDKEAFDVYYQFANNIMAPINQQLFEELGDPDSGGTYGETSVDVASSGVYYLDQWTIEESITFKKNELHPDASMYHYTGYQFTYFDNLDEIFDEFIAGRLDYTAIPNSDLYDYVDDARTKIAPDDTVWSIMINGFGTEEARDQYILDHPNVWISNNYVPEPILMYQSMRQALMYGFDRYEAAVNDVGIYLPAFTLVPSTYFLDAQSGYSVRSGAAGAAIVEDFGGSSYGYFPDEALAYFKQAVDQAILDGYYEAGTVDHYTEIELVFTYQSGGNTNIQTMVTNLVNQYEALLVDDTNYVKVVFNVIDIAFPSSYYFYMMIANTDLGLGGISPNIIDSINYFEIFYDDNRTGFTLNWGFDTTSAVIPVSYHDIDGQLVQETWGFNALIEALAGKVYIKDGVIQDSWDNADDLINASLDLDFEVLDSLSVGTTFAQNVLGDTLSSVAQDIRLDELIAHIAVTESGKNILFIISVKNDVYKLYQSYELYTNAEDAIQEYVINEYGDYELLEVSGPLTDQQVILNDYVSSLNRGSGYDTVDDLLDDYDIENSLYIEIYAASWAPVGSEGWDDAAILLHIGNYYLTLVWL